MPTVMGFKMSFLPSPLGVKALGTNISGPVLNTRTITDASPKQPADVEAVTVNL